MKARITQKSGLSLNLKQSYTFDILGDDGEVLLPSQTIECSPSNCADEIRTKLTAYAEEYEKSQEIEEGTEIS